MLAPTRFARPRALGTAALLGLASALVSLPAVSARQAKPAELPPPREAAPKGSATQGPEILQPAEDARLAANVPITLLDSLKMAYLANIDIAQSRLLVERGRANYALFGSRFLPNLNAGSTYITHDGTIQNTLGNISEVDRDSLFVGLGTALSVNLSDALFLPAEARRLLDAVRIGQVRVTNDTLLQVANAYFAVLLARRRLAAATEGLEMLISSRKSELRGDSQGLLPLIRAFVRAGTALPSDQARVEADVVRQHDERTRAAEDLRTASAELARLLRLDPTIFLMPADDFRGPLPIQGTAWADASIDLLVAQALRSRPELAENNSLIEAALARYRATHWQPYLPTISGSYSFGGFGGGPPVVGRTASGGNILGNSGTIANFDTRNDFEINAYWRLQGLGFGNAALQRDARLRVDSSRLRQIQLQDIVVSQVVRALEDVQRSRERIAIIRASLFDDAGRPTGAVYRSIRLNFLRIQRGQGTPLEVLDSIRRLTDLLNAYNAALTSYDQARYRLIVRIGMPTAALLDPTCMPLPPRSAAPGSPPKPSAGKAVAPTTLPRPEEEKGGKAAPVSSGQTITAPAAERNPLPPGGIAGGGPFNVPYAIRPSANPAGSGIVAPDVITPAVVPVSGVESAPTEKPRTRLLPDGGSSPR